MSHERLILTNGIIFIQIELDQASLQDTNIYVDLVHYLGTVVL